MPGWVPNSIGLAGLLGQLSATSSPSPSPSPTSGGWTPPGWTDPTPTPDSSGGGGDPSWLQYLIGGPEVTEYLRNLFGPGELGMIGQLGAADPVQQLAQLIANKMGVSLSPNRDDPTSVARTEEILAYAKKAQNDPTLRQQLAASMGWNLSNPHVQYWLQNGGGIPAKPTELDAGTAPAGGPGGAGVTGSGQPSTDPASAHVPFPYPYADFNNSSYQGNNYGDPKPPGVDWGGWQWHQGQDYYAPQGTQLASPFYGKVVASGYDPSGYGNYVTIEFGNQGMRLTFAHLSERQVNVGQVIQPGTQLGLTGGDQPGGGISTGHHLLIVEQNANGIPIDPRPLMNAIYNGGNGTTFQALETAGVAQTGTLAPSGTSFGYELTPDGVTLYEGTPDRAYYDMVNTAYSHYYGTNAPYALVVAMRAAGVTNSSQMAAVAANWPSDITGLTFSQRDGIYNTANSISTKNWNRPIPDSLVKRLAAEGYTTPDDIRLWFDSHLPTDIPAAEYQQIYDAAAPALQSTYGEGPAPDFVGYLWGQISGSNTAPPAPTTTGTTQGASPNLPGQYQQYPTGTVGGITTP